MTGTMYDNLDANSDSQKLKLKRLRLPKTLFYDFQVILTLECTEFNVTITSQKSSVIPQAM